MMRCRTCVFYIKKICREDGKKISKVVADVLPEVEIPELTQKMGMNRKTAHTYAKEFKGSYGQVRDVIVVEATWLGYFEPYTTKTISWQHDA